MQIGDSKPRLARGYLTTLPLGCWSEWPLSSAVKDSPLGRRMVDKQRDPQPHSRRTRSARWRFTASRRPNISEYTEASEAASEKAGETAGPETPERQFCTCSPRRFLSRHWHWFICRRARRMHCLAQVAEARFGYGVRLRPTPCFLGRQHIPRIAGTGHDHASS